MIRPASCHCPLCDKGVWCRRRNDLMMKYNSDILSRLHEELLQTLREVVRVCDEASIPYFIQGGTAIGAHFFEGIVPWDDDIDLGMTRDNYDRFLREAPALLSSDYVLQEFSTEPDTPFYFAKVRRRSTRFVESEWVGLPIEQGIYIDIFPYDNIPDSPRLERRQRRRVKFWVNCFTAKSVWLWRWFGRPNNGCVFPKSAVSCAAIRIVCAVMSKRRIYDHLRRELTRYDDRPTRYVNIVRMPRDMIAREAVENRRLVPFGGMMLWAPSDMETYLRNHYGNIRKWLPEELQLNHAPEILAFATPLQSPTSRRISVVMPLYNKRREVERAVRSVLAQSLLPSEIIVVDDGSTDGLAEAVEALGSPLVRVVRQANMGVSAARNRGIAEARGEYVALLDADDEYLTGYIAEICRLIERYPEADAYSTAFDIVDGGRRVAAAVPSYEGYVDPAAEALKRRFAIIPSTATLRRSAVGGGGEVFPEGMRIGEDQWLWVRMMQRGSKFCFSQASLVRYSRSASNRSASIYRSECTRHSIEELYDASQSDTLNEYIARIGIGKALTQIVRGGDEDARRAVRAFSYTRLNRRQLRRLRLLAALPKCCRGLVDALYRRAAWIVSRRGL